MLSRALSAGIVAVLVLYPLLVYFGLRYFGAAWLAVLLIAVCVLRVSLSRWSRGSAAVGPQLWLVCGGGILLAAVSILQRSADAILYYPVVMNAGMLLVFAHSLVYPPTAIERIARLSDGDDLPPEAISYTRRVTVAWSVFFVCNGAIALYTALFTSLETWALYNGAIAYVLIAAMFGGELLIRLRFRRKLRG